MAGADMAGGGRRRAGPVATLVTGAVSGAAATGVMSVLMVAWQQLAGGGRMPPGVITDQVLGAVGVLPAHRVPRHGTQTAAHVAFGSGAGATYAGLTRLATTLVPAAARIPGPARGAGFGLALWGATYGSSIPALGLVPWPPRDVPRRQPRLVAAHLLYGATLGALAGRR